MGSGRDSQDTFVVFRKVHRASSPDDKETWEEAQQSNNLNCFDVGERDTHAVVAPLYVQPVSDPISAVEQRRWTAEGCTFRTVNLTAVTQGVRRLTPRECERLQGFPDDWTLIPYRGGQAKDSPRYKAIGNSMAVPVMAWIGRRIAMVDAISPQGSPQTGRSLGDG